MADVYYRVVDPIGSAHEAYKGSTGKLIELQDGRIRLQFKDGQRRVFLPREVKVVGMVVHTLAGDLYLISSTADWWYRADRNPFTE